MVSTKFPSLGLLVNEVLRAGRKLISALGIPLHSAAAAAMACAGSLPAVIIVLPSAFVAPALMDVLSNIWIAEASVRKSGIPALVISGISANAAVASNAARHGTIFVIAHLGRDRPPRGGAPWQGNRRLESLRAPPAAYPSARRPRAPRTRCRELPFARGPRPSP